MIFGRGGAMLLLGAFALVMLFSISAEAENYSPSGEPERALELPINPPSLSSSSTTYDGHLRLYIVEPSSRWRSTREEFGRPYFHYGLLDYAYNADFSITESSTFDQTITWDASVAGWGDAQEGNIMVIAVVFNLVYTIGYANPPSGNPFICYPADAAAGARPGETGANVAVGDFTHTVFAEEATQTPCTYCPYALFALDSIDKSLDYPFFYVALVEDKTSVAHNRCVNDFNTVGYPSLFFDGGDSVVVGALNGYQAIYREKIEACGQREVTGLLLNIDVEWVGDDVVSTHVTIALGDPTNQAPVCSSAPVGADTVLNALSYTYSATATDPEGQQVYYKWDFGDGVTDWIGPFASGEPAEQEHSWSVAGDYIVKVKSKDQWGEESGWSGGITVSAFYCGDADGQNQIDLDDVVYLIAYIFTGGPAPVPLIAGDADCVNAIDLDDVVYLIAYIFTGGPAPCIYCP
ncbi:MAG: PKD domain-containing protein [candidate division Zixibacteria bacterium]|nr:PKD domain-containing protein [candidate division Zixibacteria bacterium]MBU1471855.1 PKD domain-containing protein [candidate division Zixibacteria bacterium]MBU2625695.1 PKD domain-containing protein [candidate division Zixibacteria bacterium]